MFHEGNIGRFYAILGGGRREGWGWRGRDRSSEPGDLPRAQVGGRIVKESKP